MISDLSHFEARLAQTPAEHDACYRLRYEVFVAELGGDGPLVDHHARTERDAFDAYCDQLILLDHRRAAGDQVVGVYRLLSDAAARRAGRFYTDAEYDLGVLQASGRQLLELGRSCLHVDYRGGAAMYQLWAGLAGYVQREGIEVLFGVASFHGTDVDALAQPLSLLHHKHLAPEGLRVRSRNYLAMDRMPLDRIDRVAAMAATPALIKAYLRLGGVVGEGAFVDHAFNTTDVCLVLDTARMPPRQSAIYGAGQGVGR